MPNETKKGTLGRPPRPLLEPINRPMDEIARVVLRASAKSEWRYQKRKPRHSEHQYGGRRARDRRQEKGTLDG